MKKIANRIILIATVVTFVFSCGGSDDSSSDRVVNVPAKPILSLPVNGEMCATYTAVPSDDTKAEITFNWDAVSNATTYVLNITESGNSVASRTTSEVTYKVILQKGKTYSWTVTAKNKHGENTSVTNSFTTPGVPIGNYVPYAAVINFNVNNVTSMATLSWVGKDEDAVVTDLRYNVTVTEDANTLVSLEKTAQLSVPSFNAKLNSTYIIKVDTYDKLGSYATSTINYLYK